MGRVRWRGGGLGVASLLATTVAVAALGILLGDVLLDGAKYLTGHFFSNYASRFPDRAGIRAPLAGTLWLLALTGAFTFPVSLGAALYLDAYAPQTRMGRAIRWTMRGLAGVPSIVYGLLGLAVFVQGVALGRSILAGALTLSMLSMPIMVLAMREALGRVPSEVREAAYALGASRWQVVRFQLLPLALPDIVSGTALALTRAVGETAPLVLVGAVTFIAFTPEGPMDPFTALPVQVFHWVTRPQGEFQDLAAAAILVLLVLLLGLNGAAMILRRRLSGRH